MIQIEVIAPGKLVFKGEAISVKLPGDAGEFGVLKNHAPLISTLGKGNLSITDVQNKIHNFGIEGGVVEVLNNKISVLAEKTY